MAAEKFNHSIKSLSRPHQHDNDDELTSYFVVVQKSPIEKKNKEPDKGKPLEEFNFGGVREKGEGITGRPKIMGIGKGQSLQGGIDR